MTREIGNTCVITYQHGNKDLLPLHCQFHGGSEYTLINISFE